MDIIIINNNHNNNIIIIINNCVTHTHTIRTIILIQDKKLHLIHIKGENMTFLGSKYEYPKT